MLASCFVLSSFATSSSHATPDDLVPSIPGYGEPPAPIYAGTLPVDTPSRGVELFYVFSSKPKATDSTPIVLWLQGGGGASPPWGNQTGPFALDGYAGGGPSTFGMLCEKIGPFGNPDNATGKWVLKDNPNTWNTHAHLIFIDQPAGVGLSSFSASENGYAQNGTMLGHDVATALVRFFERHAELGSNPLYIFGESYAGHYVPHIANFILEHGTEPFYAALRKRFVGVGLGDVCPGEEHTLSLPHLVHGLGYLSPAQLVQAGSMASRCKADLFERDFAAAFKSCEALEVFMGLCWTLRRPPCSPSRVASPLTLLWQVFKGLASGGVHDQDSRVYANYSSLAELVNVDGATSEGDWMLLANAWLDDPATRDALHVGVGAPAFVNRSVNSNQVNCTRGLWDDNDNAKSTIAYWPRLIANLRVLVYNGNFDVSCNFLGTETMLSGLGGWFEDEQLGAAYTKAWGARERRWFTLHSQMAGYWRHVPLPTTLASGELTHVIVQGAGHLAPRDQPERVTAMLGRFLSANMTTLCDEQHGLCRATDVALSALGSRCALLFNCSDHGTCTDEGACECEHGFAGADCAEGIDYMLGNATTATYIVRPGGWQYHFVSARAPAVLSISLHANTSAVPKRELPRSDPHGPAGLRVYLASEGTPWPLDVARGHDLSRSFEQAWRVDGATAEAPLQLPPLRAGAVLGVTNAASDMLGDYHAPSRAYTVRVAVAMA